MVKFPTRPGDTFSRFAIRPGDSVSDILRRRSTWHKNKKLDQTTQTESSEKTHPLWKKTAKTLLRDSVEEADEAAKLQRKVNKLKQKIDHLRDVQDEQTELLETAGNELVQLRLENKELRASDNQSQRQLEATRSAWLKEIYANMELPTADPDEDEMSTQSDSE